jgi:hypothetical protein
MIARYAPIGRGWGWLAAGLLLALALTGLTDAADPNPAAGPPVATIAPTEPDEGKRPPAAEPVPKPIADAIVVLRTMEIRNPGRWGRAIHTLARIGKPALPPLIEELDRTTEHRALGSLAFALRAMGDPRAVPALIRAIPRTLVENSGDFGLVVFDPELLVFLQRHDVDPGARGLQFAFGTPYHEITGALHALTGQRFPIEEEMHFIGLQGSPKQRWLKRRLFHELAAQWAVWWKKNWQRFTDDPAYAKISLPPLPEAPQVAAAAGDQPFPMGNRVQVANGPANAIVGPPQPQDYYRTFKDLDTDRELPWPKELPDASKVKGDEITAFAAREGLDLRGTEYTPPGSGRSSYAIQGLGLRAWQIDNSRYFTIEDELRAGRPPKLDRPAGELLMDFDPKTGTYIPRTRRRSCSSPARGRPAPCN